MFRTLDHYEETGLGLPYPVILDHAAEELLDVDGERVGVRVPNLEGLAAAIAVARSLEPLQLAGQEVRFIRRVLGLTQRELADELELDAVETISRWENNGGGGAVGGYIEKLLRTLTLIQLRNKAPQMTLDQDAIVHLRIMKREPGQWPVMVAKPVIVADEVEWDLPRAA